MKEFTEAEGANQADASLAQNSATVVSRPRPAACLQNRVRCTFLELVVLGGEEQSLSGECRAAGILNTWDLCPSLFIASPNEKKHLKSKRVHRDSADPAPPVQSAFRTVQAGGRCQGIVVGATRESGSPHALWLAVCPERAPRPRVND